MHKWLPEWGRLSPVKCQKWQHVASNCSCTGLWAVCLPCPSFFDHSCTTAQLTVMVRMVSVVGKAILPHRSTKSPHLKCVIPTVLPHSWISSKIIYLVTLMHECPVQLNFQFVKQDFNVDCSSLVFTSKGTLYIIVVFLSSKASILQLSWNLHLTR